MCDLPVEIWFCMGKTEVPCRVSENIDPCVAPCFSSPVLLLFWDFGQASGHVGAQQPRDWDGTATCFFFFFFHLQVSHWEVQPTLLSEVLMLLPSLQVLPQLVGRLGQGCQKRAWQLSHWLWTHMPGIRCFTAAANRLSPAPSCALPCLKPSISCLMVAFLTERYSHWPARSFQQAACALQLKTTSTSAPDKEKVLKQWQSWTSSYHHRISLHCISSVFKIRWLCIASVNGTVCCI